MRHIGIFTLIFTAEFCSAQSTYGLGVVTVGRPGNRAATRDEAPALDWRAQSVGSVAYEFRITRTEITNSQWLEFVLAYAPYYHGSPIDTGFTGNGITYVGNGNFYMSSVAANRPASMSWQMAARYCNWLQNGKANTAAAFEQGVYDTATFTQNADRSWNDVRDHAAGANYWIPDLDEWSKAAYYDPNKQGPGREGYWIQPGMSDVPLIPGSPGTGQTSAGTGSSVPPPVGSYPGVTSPWGLLDTSGGVSEWLGGQLVTGANSSNDPWQKGTSAQSLYGYDLIDRLDCVSVSQPQFATAGLRLAMAVPSPSVTAPLAVMVFMLIPRRSR